MPEMYGKGQCITCQDKTNFGSSTPICKSWLANTRRRGRCLHDGWNGAPGKKPGWPLLSLKKEWESLKIRKLFSTVTLKHILTLIHISRSLSSSLEIAIARPLEAYMSESSPSSAQKLFRKTISFSSRSSRSKTESMRGLGKFLNSG